MTWADNPWLASAKRTALQLLDSCLMLMVRAAVQVGWRTFAACCGVLSAGWIASAIPEWIDASRNSTSRSAVPHALARPVSITGALASDMPGPQVAVISTAQTENSRPAMPEWALVQRPVVSFSLGLPDVGGQPIRHQLRRDLHSHLREEQIKAGEFAVDAAYATITVRNVAAGTRPAFFIDMTRLAAEGGHAITRTANPVAMASKFGLVETADMVMDTNDAPRVCIGFRHAADSAAFSFQGWLCGSAARAADRQQLTCMIDRLNLVSSGEDRALRSYFSKAELNRQQGCLSPKLAAAGRKTSWLDADQASPQLRRNGG